MIEYFDAATIGKGPVRVVQHDGLETAMLAGWKLVAMTTIDEQVYFRDQAPHPHLVNDAYHHPQTIEVERCRG